MTSKQLINQLCYEYSTKNYNEEKLKTTHAIKKNLEILEQLETLKKYYPPFKEFLDEMFEKGYNEDLKKVKEWLENENKGTKNI